MFILLQFMVHQNCMVPILRSKRISIRIIRNCLILKNRHLIICVNLCIWKHVNALKWILQFYTLKCIKTVFISLYLYQYFELLNIKMTTKCDCQKMLCNGMKVYLKFIYRKTVFKVASYVKLYKNNFIFWSIHEVSWKSRNQMTRCFMMNDEKIMIVQ